MNRAFSTASWGLMNPGALPQASSECCAFGAKTPSAPPSVRRRIVWIVFVQPRWIAKDRTEGALGPDLKIAQQQRHQRHHNESEAVGGHHEHRYGAQHQEIHIPAHPLLELVVGHCVIARLKRLPEMFGRKRAEGELECWRMGEMPTTGIRLRASTAHASGRDANSRRCCESGGGAICRGAIEPGFSGGFAISADYLEKLRIRK